MQLESQCGCYADSASGDPYLARMKTKQYVAEFTAFIPTLEDQRNLPAALMNLANTLMLDLVQTKEKRNIQTDRALVPLVNEFQKKWLSIRAKLYRHYGQHILASDGFLNLLLKKYPEVHLLYVHSTLKRNLLYG